MSRHSFLLSWCSWTLFSNNLLTLVVFLVAFLCCRRYWVLRKQKLPPGPWGLPVLGFLPFLGGKTHQTLHKLADRYGPIFRVSMGNTLMVVLSDPSVIREAFRREEFCGRPNLSTYDMFDGYGLINTEGWMWRNQRRFLHERLRSLGMKLIGPGRTQMESMIMKEVKSLLEILATEKGAPIYVDTHLNVVSTNIISSMLMSIRYCSSNPQFLRFKELFAEGLRLFLETSISLYVPMTKYIPKIRKNFSKLTENRKECNQMFSDIITERKRIFNPDKVRDVLDAYLLEQYKANEEGTILYYGKDFDRQLLQVLCDVLGAGEESVKTCLSWALVFFLHNPDVVKKIQRDMDRVIGRSRLPCLDDLPELPYLEATLCEVMRIANVVPLGTFHATTRDTTLSGYDIPKGTNIVPLLYACHMDSKYWDDPWQFKPERFLTEEMKVVRPKQFMPFGVGRRMCLGEVLARSEIFLVVASILHFFELKNPEGRDLPSLEGVPGATLTPKPFGICFVPREASFLENLDTESSRRKKDT